MIIDCISDLHGFYPKLEGGDLLIVAGDLTARNTPEEHAEYIKWQYAQPYKKIIFIAGNHDGYIMKSQHLYLDGCDPNAKVVYLQDSGIEYEGFKIWGSPWSLWFLGISPHCKAFTGSEQDLSKRYRKIPRNTEILITHSPPFNVLDRTIDDKMVGSQSLLEFVGDFKPRLHVFGHIHEAYGKMHSYFGRKDGSNKYGVSLVNCSLVNEQYQPVNKPIRIEL